MVNRCKSMQPIKHNLTRRNFSSRMQTKISETRISKKHHNTLTQEGWVHTWARWTWDQVLRRCNRTLRCNTRTMSWAWWISFRRMLITMGVSSTWMEWMGTMSTKMVCPPKTWWDWIYLKIKTNNSQMVDLRKILIIWITGISICNRSEAIRWMGSSSWWHRGKSLELHKRR